MTDTIAKPIVNGKFWVLQKDNQKIGSVEKTPTGYFLKTNQGSSRFKTVKSLRDITKINFDNVLERVKYPENQVNPAVYGELNANHRLISGRPRQKLFF